jgi:hypothetical protein
MSNMNVSKAEKLLFVTFEIFSKKVREQIKIFSSASKKNRIKRGGEIYQQSKCFFLPFAIIFKSSPLLLFISFSHLLVKYFHIFAWAVNDL